MDNIGNKIANEYWEFKLTEENKQLITNTNIS